MICWSFHCHRLSMNHFRSAPVPANVFFCANFYCKAGFFIDLSVVSAPHWLLKSHYYFRSSAHCLSLKKHHHIFLFSVNCLFPIDFSALTAAPFCGFCLSRILLYFPVSVVRPSSVCHRRDISVFHLYNMS